MARTPVRELTSYLLRGRLHHRGCLHLRHRPLSRLLRPDLPAGRAIPVGSSCSFSSSASRFLSQESSPEAVASPDRSVPLRKELKDIQKAQKASEHKGPPATTKHEFIPGWLLSVGIEIHAQLNTQHKLFSPASQPTASDEPNTRVALFDLAVPGSQPVFQHEALVPALRASLALNCKIRQVSRWDRKHYFWWDQPSGYQITQYYEPLAKDGYITLYPRDGISKYESDAVRVRIRQVQMEQDTAKTIARPDGVQWVDFNRVGVPLIEIITAPDIHYPKTAAALVSKVQRYLNAVDSCVSGMEAGGLRADVNVSVSRYSEPGQPSHPLGQRTEIKNLSSFKAVEDAIIAERDRQIALLEAGGVVVGETRGWSIGGTETTRLRGKEGEVDYRYMPEPDLPPVIVSPGLISHLQRNLVMLPDAELDELVGRYGLKTNEARTLRHLDNGRRLEYFYRVVQRLQSRLGDLRDTRVITLAGNWVLHELGRLTSERNASPDGAVQTLEFSAEGECARFPAQHLADIVYYLHTTRIRPRVAKELLFAVYRGDLSGTSPESYSSIEEAIEKENLWFNELPREDYRKLAIETTQNCPNIMLVFYRYYSLPYSERGAYPEGQLTFLVGKMMQIGPAARMDAEVAREALKLVLEEACATTFSSK
ncbi:aspartyl-tRNA(Asn)/glutamyl-tRNA (Gln) amidotransferase subunit B [Diaporthe helianthi]|uniref:Glutamyl-tRNA(Gln) amidotransferase subunit B, mitochondrial n=1 Tax=Diaporthe helianthi TaxID=158607 RepID=A0A2P5I955_DIAHE|nr:aspartyl-tRNA(Asn)/glutamyl-tRNA (Gln) amidotransferase subunit B [Diaporthe helianthi]